MSELEALKKDQNDALALTRDKFALADDCVYFDGNSLGALPKNVETKVQSLITQQWGKDLIRSWNTHAWIDLPFLTAEKIAPLVGAATGQLVCCDSISVNIFKLLSTALEAQAHTSSVSRNVILSQANNFPTDLYMVQGMEKLLGDNRCKLTTSTGNILQEIDESVALVLLSHINYRSGEILDMAQITERAHDCGALVLWDLAHSAGAIPIELDACNVDFAVGCGYKFLNGGPGAPAFLYVADRHQNKYSQALSGWMGHRSPFDFSGDYQAGQGMSQFLCGTPNILSMAALNAALDVFAELEMREVRRKSLALSDFLIELVDRSSILSSLKLITPRAHGLRGSQVSFSHPHAFAISQALVERNIIPDFRAPDILRCGITPLYSRFIDVLVLVESLEEIVGEKHYLQEKYSIKSKVT